MTAKGFTGPNVSIADVNGLQEALDALAPDDRLLAAGETVLRRGDATTASPLATGTLFATHFRAARTETIQTIRTGTGGAGTVGVGTTHAWIGILGWDGSQYTPVASSVDDPTRWAGQFATYNTQLFAWDHVGEAGHEGFSKIRGVDYAMFMLWIGTGQAPSLAANAGWYQDSLDSPRINALILGQTQPPAAPLNGAFFGSDNRRFQGVMLP